MFFQEFNAAEFQDTVIKNIIYKSLENDDPFDIRLIQ